MRFEARTRIFIAILVAAISMSAVLATGTAFENAQARAGTTLTFVPDLGYPFFDPLVFRAPEGAT